jgi:DNA-binding transcriptional regulator of glucitol operon
VFSPNGWIYSGGVDGWVGVWNEKGDFVIYTYIHILLYLKIEEIPSKIVKNLMFT